MEAPQKAKYVENHRLLMNYTFSLFVSDGPLGPEDGSKIARESPKRGPGGLQDGPKSAPRASREGPTRQFFGLRRGDRNTHRIFCRKRINGEPQVFEGLRIFGGILWWTFGPDSPRYSKLVSKTAEYSA